MEQLITGFYTQFVLRDFLGRIVPGAIFLLICSFGCVSPADVYAFLVGLPSFGVLVLAGTAWTAATGLQFLSERFIDLLLNARKVIEVLLKPKKLKDVLLKAKKRIDDLRKRFFGKNKSTGEEDTAPPSAAESYMAKRAKRLSRLVDFARVATDSERMRRERFAVIRHACTTTAAALLLGALTCAALACATGRLPQALHYLPHLVWLIPSSLILCLAAGDEYGSQRAYEEAVLAKPPPAGTA